MATPSISLREISLDDRPYQDISLDLLLEQSKNRSNLAHLAHHISGMMHSIEAKLQRIAELGAVTYLIDNDVVRNFVEGTFSDAKLVREADQLFAEPTFNYALPYGAFQEMVNWCRKLPGTQAERIDSALAFLQSGDRRASISALAQSFGASPRRHEPEEATIQRLQVVIERESPVLQRLIALLTNPRFDGVKQDYDLDDVHRFYDLLKRAPRASFPTGRHTSESERAARVKKDFRDAINLALVFKSHRDRASLGQSSAAHLLITQTHAIRHLHDFVREQLEDKHMSSLVDLLGFDGTITDGVYPVLSPREAFIVEQVRSRSEFGAFMDRLSEDRGCYDRLTRVLRSGNRIVNRIESDAELKACLLKLATVYQSDAVLRSIEKEHLVSASIEYFEAKQRAASDPRRVERLKDLVTTYVSTLRSLHERIDTMTRVSYRVIKSRNEDFPDIQFFTVDSEPEADALITGEVYGNALPAKRPTFVARWRTGCTETQFFEALTSVLRIDCAAADEPDGAPYLALRQLTADDDRIWREGFIVYTPGAPYGCGLRELRAPDLSDITLEMIRNAVVEADLSASSGNEGAERSTMRKVISAIRLATPLGDFQIDIINVRASDRYVTVMSSYDISPQVTHLCERTALIGIFPLRLNKELACITQNLARPRRLRL